jgi:hypothetical protein
MPNWEQDEVQFRLNPANHAHTAVGSIVVPASADLVQPGHVKVNDMATYTQMSVAKHPTIHCLLEQKVQKLASINLT